MRIARSSTVTGGSPWQRPLWTETPANRDPRTETPLDKEPPCGQTDACENITLPQTSFAAVNIQI